MKFKSIILGIAAAAFALTGCNSSSDNDNDDKQIFVDVATLESNSTLGASLTLRKLNDSPLVTLTSPQQFDPSYFKVGKRVVIAYAPANGEQYVSGPVSIYSAVLAIGEGDKPEPGTAEATNNWASGQIKMISAWRTGKYLNLAFNGSTYSDPVCHLYLDKATADTDNPHLYFTFAPKGAFEFTEGTFYASYNIEDLWDDPNVKSITLSYCDTNDANASKNFVKGASEITPAE